MIYRASTKYIHLLQKHLLSSDLIFSILTIIELLPILYQTVKSSFFLSQDNFPEFIKQIHYISFYHLLKSKMNKDYPIFLWIGVIIIFLGFLIYKYTILPFFQIKNGIHKLVINFYEIVINKMFCIFVLDIEINCFFSSSLVSSLVGLLLIILTISGLIFHFSGSYLYYNLKDTVFFPNGDKMFLLYNQYLILIKLLICLILNYPNYALYNKNIEIFLNLLLIMCNFAAFFHEMLIYLMNEFIFLSKELYISTYLCLNLTIIFKEILILTINTRNFAYFLYFLFCLLCLSIVLIGYFKRNSIFNVLSIKSNYLSILVFILKNYSQKVDKYFITYFIYLHKIKCRDNSKCKFCEIIEQNQTADKTSNNVEYPLLIFKYLVKPEKKAFKKVNSEYWSYYYLTDFYLHYLFRKQKIIKTVLKYNEIMRNQKQHLFFNFGGVTMNFFINIDLLFEQSIEQKKDNQKLAYLIPIYKISKDITFLIGEVNNFLEIKLYNVKKIAKLAKIYSDLKTNIDTQFFTSKEFSLNYLCILLEYILENIYNEQIVKIMYITDIIDSIEDLLEIKYQEDAFLLLFFDVKNSQIVMKQSGKELNHLKDKNIEEIFPPYLMEEGKKKILYNLKKNLRSAEYYYNNSKKQTIEYITLFFLCIPSLELTNNSLYLICNYQIKKGNFLVFENILSENQNKEILIQLSENICHLLKLSPTQLLSSLETNNYIFKSILLSQNLKINFSNLQNVLTKKLQIKNSYSGYKEYKVYLHENYNKYLIYNLEESKLNDTNKPSLSKISRVLNNFHKNSLSNQNNEIDYHFTTTQTGTSISLTNSHFSYQKKSKIDSFNDCHSKHKKFLYYTYFFSICILADVIILITFLIIELQNNLSLKEVFQVIVNFYDFSIFFLFDYFISICPCLQC